MKKKNRIWIYPFIVMGLLLMLTNSCKKDDDKTGQAPSLVTFAVSDIKQITATCGGNITSDGGSTVTARGVCWSTGQTPTIANSKTNDGTGVGNFTSAITGLNTHTTYYVRAYATNEFGTGYGNTLSFTTGQITDIDGNIYQTVQIGNQVWMAENLKITKYNDGTPIPLVTDTTAWGNLTTLAYCWYNNDPTTYGEYGALYNWYTVNTDKLCPVGWHVPTDAEWDTLVNYLGGASVAGGKLKEADTSHWSNPNAGATNEAGFTALPGGYRSGNNGAFYLIGDYGYWWSSTASSPTGAWSRSLGYINLGMARGGDDKGDGRSVRCIED